LLTASTAWLVSGRVGAHADIVPSSVAQMKAAVMLVSGTVNPVLPVVGFHTMPVGAALVGGGLAFGDTGMHEVADGVPPGSGIATFTGGGPPAGTPAPS
jgi:hypothetical protein